MLEASQKKDLLQDAGGVLVAVILSVMVESGVHVTISMVDTGIACGVKHRQNVKHEKGYTMGCKIFEWIIWCFHFVTMFSMQIFLSIPTFIKTSKYVNKMFKFIPSIKGTLLIKFH